MVTLGDYITTADACKISNFHPDYLRVLIRKGRITARKWGSDWMVNRESLISYLEQVKARGERRGPKKRGKLISPK